MKVLFHYHAFWWKLYDTVHILFYASLFEYFCVLLKHVYNLLFIFSEHWDNITFSKDAHFSFWCFYNSFCNIFGVSVIKTLIVWLFSPECKVLILHRASFLYCICITSDYVCLLYWLTENLLFCKLKLVAYINDRLCLEKDINQCYKDIKIHISISTNHKLSFSLYSLLFHNMFILIYNCTITKCFTSISHE